MALQTNGPINLQDIATEFGGAAPHALSEYYRGGGLVPNGPAANAAIALSGAINVGSFYGGTRRVPITVNITTNQNNYVFNPAKVSGYIAGLVDVTFIIAGGVLLSCSSVGNYAGTVDTSWNAADNISIVNNGNIIGVGGNGGGGGEGDGNGGTAAPTVGSTGGPALLVQRTTTITNYGTIGGGGGGGGAGRNFGGFSGGGGGGGGRTNSVNTAGGLGGDLASLIGNNGAGGTYSSEGAGGAGVGTAGDGRSGAGGTGGSWGMPGVTGGTGQVFSDPPAVAGASGGSAGAAIVGNGNISWLVTGTRLGAIT